MLEIPIYNVSGEEGDRIEVDEALFGGRIHKEVLRQAVLTYEANQRVGTAKAKTRKEVAGSGQKPWPQKGTGNARAGSRQSPIWVGGGITHGPAPRDYSKKMNKKARRKALGSALLGKMRDGEVKVVENLELPQPKTRAMATILENLGVPRTFLIVVDDYDEVLWRCTRNIPGSAMMTVQELNAYQVLRPREVIFTKAAFDSLLERAEKITARTEESAEPVKAAEEGE